MTPPFGRRVDSATARLTPLAQNDGTLIPEIRLAPQGFGIYNLGLCLFCTL
jgi:hypothetical protein